MIAPMRFAASRQSIAWVLATALLLVAGIGLFFKTPPAVVDGTGTGPAFDLQAGGAGRERAPRDILPAFRKALATGVTTLAIAVSDSADGVVVLPGGARPNPARPRDAGGGTRRDKDDERLPTLEAVIDLGETVSGGEIRYSIEIGPTARPPAAASRPETLVRAVIDIVGAAGAGERTVIRSLDWRALAAVRRQAPEIARAYMTMEHAELDTVRRGRAGPSPWLGGLDVDDHAASVPRTIAAAERGMADGPDATPPWRVIWSPYFRDLRAADLRRAHALNLKVVVWAADEPATMESLIDRGVDGIATSHPGRLRDVMAAKGMALPAKFGAGG